MRTAAPEPESMPAGNKARHHVVKRELSTESSTGGGLAYRPGLLSPANKLAAAGTRIGRQITPSKSREREIKSSRSERGLDGRHETFQSVSARCFGPATTENISVNSVIRFVLTPT